MTTVTQPNKKAQNTQKTTDSRPQANKERASWRSLRSIGVEVNPLLSDEQLAGYAALERELHDSYQPVDPMENTLVDKLASTLLRLERVPHIEASILETGYHEEQALSSGSGSASAVMAALERELSPQAKEQQAARAAQKTARAARTVGAVGFMVDAEGANLLAILSEYERDLYNKLLDLFDRLDARKASRTEGKIGEEK